MSQASFDDLPLSERARDAVHALGWREPTPIQREVVPQLVAGRDVIGRAETGSGKTAAFGLVLTDQIKAPGVQALVLAPTRELAVQITSDLNALAANAPFRAVAIYGGVPYDGQLAALADPGVTCIVATTGRLRDLLQQKRVLLDDVRFVVLDEADRMLDLGFLPEVERILKLIPGSRQTALFTATMPKKIAMLAHRYMAHAREIEVGRLTPESADHYRVDVHSADKMTALLALLETEKPRHGLIFTRTRDGAHALARELEEAGHPTLAFSGDLRQEERDAVVAGLREGNSTLVVATDVAARGLDIPGLTHVINYDIPEEAEQYVHRAGRTARAGKAGRVFTLITENDGAHAEAAERAARLKLRTYSLRITTDAGGAVQLTRDKMVPKKAKVGGYARGAKRKSAPTPPKPVKVDDVPMDDAAPREAEFDLPPSRRRRDRE